MEEETEAMATQFSTVAMGDEVFSKLPEHVIHRILTFLPCIKEVARTSIISKSCLHAWRTFSIPEFNLEDFVLRSDSVPRDEFEAKSKQFIRFVDDSLIRFGRQNRDGLKSFNLSTVNKMAYQINRWIGMALDSKVEHLSIRIFVGTSRIPCMFPDTVLSADSLKSLILSGPMIYLPTDKSRVCLPSLTSLCLQYSTIPDSQLRKLLRGCPALESLDLLNCESLSEVEIIDHRNLQSLEVTVSTTSANLTSISVRAPKLKVFGYTCECLYKRNVFVEVLNSPDLRCLKISDWNKKDKWFHNFVAQFSLLESLDIDWCNAFKRIKISNPLLKRISIQNCNNLEDVVIDCKNVSSFFMFSLPSALPKPSIRMENPPRNCTAQIIAPIQCDLLLEASWYSKLKEFLTRSVTFKRLNLIVQALSASGGDMMEEDVHKKLPSKACTIEKLRLNVTAPSSCHAYILNGLLSACHPTTIKLDVYHPDSPFVKLVCQELEDKETNCNCSDEGDFICWKHQLKEVKIEKIQGIELQQDFDWDDLFYLLPTLQAESDIYFKLQW